jgi:hypothetical protein
MVLERLWPSLLLPISNSHPLPTFSVYGIHSRLTTLTPLPFGPLGRFEKVIAAMLEGLHLDRTVSLERQALPIDASSDSEIP